MARKALLILNIPVRQTSSKVKLIVLFVHFLRAIGLTGDSRMERGRWEEA